MVNAAHRASGCRWTRRVLSAMLAGSLSACAPAPDTRQQLADAVVFAQDRCYRLIHHDTFAYHACIAALLREEANPTPKRLGIEYFGWAGALNSARMGMRGAETTAYDFLKRFRATQAQLGIDDATLCRSIPGDCDARIARMRQMEAAPAPAVAPPDEANTADASGHED
jgi:hypothetical protein